MEPSRSSSRLRENVKTKFKNTSNTPLTVDDDDDFVSPAPGINIPGNKQGVLGAGQKPKFTKSTASRMQQDCSKGKAVGGQKEETKILGPIQDDKGLEKRVNTKKTVTETSGVRKGKMKVVDKSNTKNRKDAEKKRNPPVKKRKLGGNEGTNKVIDIGSSSKPSKKVKINEHEDCDVDKKTYPPGFRTLSTRMTPGKLSLTLKTLSDVQKDAVKKMGFGSLLGMNLDNIPGKLNYMLVDNYDPTRNRLKVNNGWINITKELVHDIMGLPMGGENIKELESCAYNDPVLQQWKAQYPKKLYSAKAYSRLINETEEDDIIVKVPVNNLKKGRPFIKYVRSIHLDDIQKEEIKQNKLGMGEIEKRCSENFDTSNDDTDLQEIQNMFGNVEAYCAVIELGYNKIVSEKLNLEKALSDGLEKYPESGVLKEWLHKKNMLFKEEDEIVDEDLHENEEDEDDVEKSDDRDEGQKEKQIESHKSKHVAGVGMESNLNLNVINTDGSRVGEYQAKEDMADRRVYDTPKSFAQIESEDISATQFFEDPAVLEQVIDVLDKSSEKYYKDKVSESAKVEGHVENERIIENVTSRVLDKGKNILTELDHAAGVGEDGVKGKRKLKVTNPFKSPFMKRTINMTDKLKKEEINFCNAIFTSDIDHKKRDHTFFIDCWAGYLNRMEHFKSDASPRRLFFDTNVVNAYLMDENELEINRRRLFVDQMLLYIGNFEINPKFRDVGLVFFPIVARDNYYLLCFDLRRPFYYIIDHLKRNGNQQSSYGRVPQIVKDKVMLESEAYDNLDMWEKTIKLDEYAKSKKKKKQRKKA
ncbi:hypothetical protein L1887_00092 [Cichorium endivia]|nr:hypothetical protein L1887_00092 [Cichorium endivia]